MKSTLRSERLSCVLIDDNRDHIELISHAIEIALRDDALRLEILTFTDPIEGLAELPADTDTIIFIDHQLSGSTGTEWISDLTAARVGPVIMLTSSGDEHIAAEAFREGVSDYLLKDEVIRDPSLLRTAMRESMRRYSLEQKNRELSRQLKITNQELNRRNDRLRELTESAHRFVDDVAHEFRTPLTVIKEFASIIDDGLGGEVSEKQHGYLRFIIDATRDLSGLIDDFLNSSKLRANAIRVKRRPIPVSQIIDTIWPMILTRAGARGIEVKRTIEDALPRVFADADKAQRTLLNLVVNAIKFSEDGSCIEISASREDDERVRISVRDEGPGLPEDACRKLFERFTRFGESSRKESIAGFGLGLSIVKELAAINLGGVSVESTLGEGSTFSFTLPIDTPECVIRGYERFTQARSPKAIISILRIVADEHAIASDGLRDLLETISGAQDLVLPGGAPGDFVILGEGEEFESLRERVSKRLRQTEGIAERLDNGGIELRPIGQCNCGQLMGYMDRLGIGSEPREWEKQHV